MVRLPDAAGQVRNAPVKALRGFFAGIGQLLMTAERFRTEESRREKARRPREEADLMQAAGQPASGGGPARGPRGDMTDPDAAGADRYEPLTAPRRPAASSRGRDRRDSRGGRHRATGLPGPAASAQAPARRFRSLDSTGNVRLLTAGETDRAPDEDRAAAAGKPPGATATAVPAGPGLAAAPPAAGSPAEAADLPVPGYDQLTLASLRSRLRYLDIGQLRVLADYERATANRADVVGMFERRIAKLRAAATDAT